MCKATANLIDKRNYLILFGNYWIRQSQTDLLTANIKSNCGGPKRNLNVILQRKYKILIRVKRPIWQHDKGLAALPCD